VNVRIGRRLLVGRAAPGFGTKCRVCALVCSFDMNSPRSARLKAQVSTTCSPWVLMTVMTCPAATKAALPLLAGISMSDGVMANTSRSDRDHVDLDDPATGKTGHANRRPGRAL